MYNEHIMNEGRKGGTMEKVLLNMKAISKTFGSVQALKEVSLDLYAGEVLALMGENGAGKSTLMNILSGSLQPTKGEIYLKGEKVTVPGPIAAKKLGISKIHQELQIVPEMSVAENIFLGRWMKKKGGSVDFKTMAAEARKYLEMLDVHVDPATKLKDLRIGDIVSIRKAGDVIPEVVEVKKERRTGNEKNFEMIHNCPICGTTLVKKEGQVDYFCLNEHCPTRKIESLIHFAERDAMNIDGLGEKIMEDFFNFSFIRTIPDIYLLQTHREDLTRLEGYGEKSVTKLLEAIEKSKSNSLEKLLFGLGIPHVGSKTAKIIASHYHNIDNIMKATLEDLSSINDIGEIIAKSIVDYFQKEDNKIIIERLKQYGINMNYLGQKIIKDETFYGKTFVLTGTMTEYKRDEAKNLIENYGGKTSSSVSKKTDVVIAGAEPGSKYDKAVELGITIWSEEDFKKNIEESKRNN